MKLHMISTVLFSTGLTLAQVLGLPDCSIQCFIDAMSHDGCSTMTDFACHCQKPALVTEVTPCVQQACNEQDQSSVSNAVTTECSRAGVPISVPPVGGGPTSTSIPTTGENITPTNGPVSPSGPVVTLPTSTPIIPSSAPVDSSYSVPVSSNIVYPSYPATPSPPFVGGARPLNPGRKLAGAVVVIAAGNLV